jgi:site-specific recombinase XerD
LTPGEVQQLLDAAKKNPRNGVRDYCLLLLMFQHGLRVTEVCEKLKLTDVNLTEKMIHVFRMKHGVSNSQPLYTNELKAIRDWLVVREAMSKLGAANTLFISERRSHLSRSMVCQIIQSASEAAGLAHLNCHPHQLRHACGYYLANKGVDTRGIQTFLGHQNIQHTTVYTANAPNRFANYF